MSCGLQAMPDGFQKSLFYYFTGKYVSSNYTEAFLLVRFRHTIN